MGRVLKNGYEYGYGYGFKLHPPRTRTRTRPVPVFSIIYIKKKLSHSLTHFSTWAGPISLPQTSFPPHDRVIRVSSFPPLGSLASLTPSDGQTLSPSSSPADLSPCSTEFKVSLPKSPPQSIETLSVSDSQSLKASTPSPSPSTVERLPLPHAFGLTAVRRILLPEAAAKLTGVEASRRLARIVKIEASKAR